MKKWVFLAVLQLFFIFSVFAQSTSDAERAERAAKEALIRLENTLSGNSSTTPGIPIPPAQVTRGGTQPAWVNDPSTAYNRNHFITAVGHGTNRNEAEKHAFLELVNFFGHSIQGDSIFHNVYSEAVSRGIITVTQDTFMQDVIVTSASLDALIGAQIGSVWDSGLGMVFALVYMDREKTISIYTDLIILNNLSIEQLTTMCAAQKITFEGYARFKLAETIAGINAKYATIVSVSGGSTTSLNIKSANSLNLEASEILRNITIYIIVVTNNDQANRIRDAFARVVTSENIRTRGNNPSYTLEVHLDLNEVTYPNNNNIYCSYVISANLIDNMTGAILLPFNIYGREGHRTFANAVTIVITKAENRIIEEYPINLREYLSGILPQE
ncbi:MAG: LPP20 family lipoprotein [Treponema sp.]|nr:LPP20 family lipoprotein [Treponema sp.]